MGKISVYMDFGHKDKVLYGVKVNGQKQSVLFEEEGIAIVYGGLVVSGLSRNDCSYMSRYIGAMVDGVKNGR